MIKPLIIIVLSCLSLIALPLHSQKVVTAQNGEKIIINPDGTWSELPETTQVNKDSIDVIAKDEVKVAAHMAYVDIEQNDYKLLRAEVLQRFEDLKAKQFKNKNNIKVVKDEIKKAKKEERDALALRSLEERKLQYYLSEYDLEKEMDALKPFKISIDRIDNQGFDSMQYNTLKHNYTAVAGNSYAALSQGTINSTENTQTNNSPKTSKAPIAKPVRAMTEAEILDRDIKRELAFYTFETDNNDVLRNPPEVKCKVKQKGIDKRTRKERTEMEAGYLFGYTHPNIKSYFKEKDYLNAYAKLSKVGGLYYLSLEVRISSIKANKTYGSLDKGSGIRIKLIDGETVNLYNITAATGFIEPLTGNTIYQTNYPMEKAEFKKLSKTELDKMGFIWSTGYEEYEIYEVDFLINQAECLKNS